MCFLQAPLRHIPPVPQMGCQATNQKPNPRDSRISRLAVLTLVSWGMLSNSLRMQLVLRCSVFLSLTYFRLRRLRDVFVPLLTFLCLRLQVCALFWRFWLNAHVSITCHGGCVVMTCCPGVCLCWRRGTEVDTRDLQRGRQDDGIRTENKKILRLHVSLSSSISKWADFFFPSCI